VRSPGDIVKVGHWTYGGTIRCRIEIQYSDVRYGSGDPEDAAEWQDDQPGDWYVVSCATPTRPAECPADWKGTPGWPSLEEAVRCAESMLRDCDLQWEP
jgi:hypothetical protein